VSRLRAALLIDHLIEFAPQNKSSDTAGSRPPRVPMSSNWLEAEMHRCARRCSGMPVGPGSLTGPAYPRVPCRNGMERTYPVLACAALMWIRPMASNYSLTMFGAA
jgi:hypothetical protein